MNSPGLERAARSRRGIFTRTFDDRLRKPVPITEMIVGVVERRHGLEVQRRENLHALARDYQLLVFRHTAVMFGIVPREQDDDGMKRGIGESANPVVGMVGARIAQHLRPGHHPLAKLLRESSQATRDPGPARQPVPGEGHCHPAPVLVDRRAGLAGRLDLAGDRREPGASGSAVMEGQELVAPGQGGRAREQDVLDVVEFKVCRRRRHRSLHLVEHERERRFQCQRLLDLVGGHIGIFAIFQKAGTADGRGRT